MKVEEVISDGISMEFGLECGEGQDMCVWQINQLSGDRTSKEVCTKHRKKG